MQSAGVDLISYLDNALGHHCPLCFFLETDDRECPHKQTPQSVAKPFSFVSEVFSHGTSPTNNSSVVESTSTIRAKVVSEASSGDETPRSLRRRSSPTGTNLRELNARHSDESLLRPQPSGELRTGPSQRTLLRAQQSDERLRQVYESQILTYLESPLSEFDPFQNPELRLRERESSVSSRLASVAFVYRQTGVR